ncbi:MAG: type I restriction enzyme S subunit [Motiliproteus sp.]|jgi:type I restriction enzyme S subunit
MEGKYRAYPEYKDSGVEWLGDIPTHWGLWKLAHAFSEIGSGTTPPSSSEEWYGGSIPWITTGELRENIVLDTVKKLQPRTLEQYPTLRKYPKGSIAIAMYGATIGRLGILGIEATTNQACCVMTFSKVIDNRYLYYWLQAFRDEIVNLSSGGGQPNINQEKVSALKISAPCSGDQKIIVSFLDHETAKIDTLIDKQQQLIQLLKEKRQAVISHAVTRGLDPKVPMKDSGVEWLGEVPEHWVVLSLGKIILDKCDGPFGSGLKSSHYTETGVRVIRLQNIKSRGYYEGEGAFIDEAYYKNNLSNHDVISEDILIAGLGDPNNPVGRACVAPVNISPAMVKADCFRFRLDAKKGKPDFITYQLNTSARIDAGRLSTGSTRARIPLSLMASRKIAICPLNEQKEIAIYLDVKLSRYDQLELKAVNVIALLKERRTALISAAVTGKIDVRNWQPADSQARSLTASCLPRHSDLPVQHMETPA